jgi:WD40 repeat protein
MSRAPVLAIVLALSYLAPAQHPSSAPLPANLPLTVDYSSGFSLTLERAWQAHQLKGEAFSYVQFSPDGKILASSSSDGSARLWNLDGTLRNKVENGNMVFRVRFNLAGDEIITAAYDGVARIWSVPEATLVRKFTGHRSGVTDAVFLHDAVATGSDDGRALITTLDGRELAVVTEQGVARNLGVSPDRRLLACAFDSGHVRIVDAAGRKLHQFDTGQGRINDVRFSRDGTKLLTAGFDGTARLWTLGGKPLLKLAAGDGDWVFSAGFNRDGTLIATVSGTGLLTLWTAGGKRLAQYRDPHGRLNSLDFSLTEDRLAVIDYTGALYLFTYRRAP